MDVCVLAVGAWLNNRACLMTGTQVSWSPLHGDLHDPAACRALVDSMRLLLQQAEAAGTPVQAIAHDLHPDFFSTQQAMAWAAQRGVPTVAVQHHHAHLAAVVAMHQLTGPVVGLALDGLGLGTDGTAWGGELLWLHGPHWARLGHLQALAQPGGDRAAREPWRMAASVLHALGRGAEIVPRLGTTAGEALASGVHHMLDQGLRCPPTSSAGRYFDAAASALGLCHHQHHEAQAAMALEQAAARALLAHPALPPLPGALRHADGCIDLRAVLAQLFDAADTDAAAAGFHLALADVLADALIEAAQSRDIAHTVLGGGCLFNTLLRQRLVQRLQAAPVQVWQIDPPGCGDTGLALGQAWVAAQQLTANHAPTRFEEHAYVPSPTRFAG